MLIASGFGASKIKLDVLAFADRQNGIDKPETDAISCCGGKDAAQALAKANEPARGSCGRPFAVE